MRIGGGWQISVRNIWAFLRQICACSNWPIIFPTEFYHKSHGLTKIGFKKYDHKCNYNTLWQLTVLHVVDKVMFTIKCIFGNKKSTNNTDPTGNRVEHLAVYNTFEIIQTYCNKTLLTTLLDRFFLCGPEISVRWSLGVKLPPNCKRFQKYHGW